MPRTVISRENFIAGSFCGFDPKDIPENGLSLGIDIDPLTKIGSLKSRYADAKKSNGYATSGSNYYTSGFNFYDGTREYDILQKSDNKLYYLIDNAAAAFSTINISSPQSRLKYSLGGDGLARIAVNRNMSPKVFGYFKRIQMVQSEQVISTDTTALESALIEAPQFMGSVVSVATDGTSYYFLLNNDGYLYKWDGSQALFDIVRSDIKMNHPKKVVYISSAVYVLDDSTNIIYEFDTNLEIDIIHTISGYYIGTTTAIISFDVSPDKVYFFIVSCNKSDLGVNLYVSVFNIATLTELDTDYATVTARDDILRYVDGSLDDAGDLVCNWGIGDITVDHVNSGVYRFLTVHKNVIYSGTYTVSGTTLDMDVDTNTPAISSGSDRFISCTRLDASYTANGEFCALLRETDGTHNESYTSNYFKIVPISLDASANITVAGESAIGTYTSINRENLMMSIAESGKALLATGGSPSFIRITPDDGTNTVDNFYSIGLSAKIASAITSGSIPAGSKVYYKASFEYDNAYESALSLAPIVFAVAPNDSAYDGYYIDFMLPSAYINKRLTAIKLYRAEATDEESVSPETNYKFIKRVPLSGRNENEIETGLLVYSFDYNTTYSLNRYDEKILDDDVDSGFTYENVSGIPEGQRDICMKFKYTCNGGGYQFIVDCTHPEIKDISNYLFRSLPNSYDSFVWSRDYQKIPFQSEIAGITYSNGRIILFDETTTIIVNAETMVVEDIFKGIGCTSHESIVSTKYGVFWLDKGGVYFWNGGLPELISAPVNYDNITSAKYGLLDRGVNNLALAFGGFDVKRQQYILAVPLYNSDTTLTIKSVVIYYYTIPYKSWYISYIESEEYSEHCVAFQGSDGIFYYVSDDDVGSGFTHIYGFQNTTTRKTGYIYTREEVITSPSQLKSLVKLRWNGVGSAAVNFAVSAYYNGNFSSANALSESATISTYIFEASLGNQKKYTLLLKFKLLTGYTLDSYEIVARPLRVK